MNTFSLPRRALAAAIVILSCWIVHGFIDAVLAACVTAVASWPLYDRFRAWLPRRVGSGASAVMFTVAVTIFVLGPLVFACLALIGEAHSLIVAVATADSRGIALPQWLANVPVAGPWLAMRWQDQLAHPGGLLMLTQRADPKALLDWAQSLGQFTLRQVLTVGFAILLLCSLYQRGDSLARELARTLRQAVGNQSDRYLEVAVRAVRASASSMLLVGLFDMLATAAMYALAGAPRALVWATITGALAAVPFLGYVAVIGMAVQLAVQGAGTTALLSLLLGSAVLLCGDKIVRPMLAREGVRLPFVWALMGCIGGFGVLGLSGVVIGPLMLALAKELWSQRTAEGIA